MKRDDYGKREKRLQRRTWDDTELSAGEDWLRKLEVELKKSDLFVLLLTPHALSSSWVLHELGAAWANNKRILVILTERGLVEKIPVDLKSAAYLVADQLDEPNRLREVIDEYVKEPAAS